MIQSSKTKYSEMTVATEYSKIIDKIIEENKLPLFGSRVEVIEKTGDGKIKRVDVSIYDKENGKQGKIVCVTEFKLPPSPLFSFYDQALGYAHGKEIPYFAVCNVNRGRLYATHDIEKYHYLNKQETFQFCDIKYGEEIEKTEVRRQIKKGLGKFLSLLVGLLKDIKVLHTLRVDESLILDLRDFVDAAYITISKKFMEDYRKEKRFREDVKEWFEKQGMEFHGDEDDFDKMARQYAYLLVDKILFYNTLRKYYKDDLSEISISGIEDGDIFTKALNGYFEKATKHYNYQTVFGMNFVDRITLPDEMTEFVGKLINTLNLYDFSSINYETLGNVYQNLIPKEKRHPLGQYFTNDNVVDLIIGFCVKEPSVRILDPGCGAGTFLVRSYNRIKYLKQEKTHKELLSQIFGIDIAKFPAHLSIINLVTRDLSENENNYPKVLYQDFFDTFPNKSYLPTYYEIETLNKEKFEIEIPHVEAVIGNPPYTRQEELKKVGESKERESYKDKLQNIIKKECEIDIGKRSGIYSYFFLHGLRFLRENGKFGFVTLNSWLDVEYGKHLQEYFLNNTKITAIIESEIERWFEDADVNTAITILEKCSGKKKRKERNNNAIKFVLLKKKLKDILPQTDDENLRWEGVMNFVDFIEQSDKNLKFKEIKFADRTIFVYDDDMFRITMVKQGDLYEEGLDEEENKYIGAKWGKYLRAPDIFFKVLEKGKDLFVPLKEVADVRFGIKTGANEFFYLTEEDIKKRGIEKEYWMHEDEKGDWIPNYVIKSPKECKSVIVNPNDLKYRVLMIHKEREELKGTNVLKYIEWGENCVGLDKKIYPFSERPTCKAREPKNNSKNLSTYGWYDLGEEVRYDFCFPERFRKRYLVLSNEENVYLNKNLYGITSIEREYSKTLCVILNSSFMIVTTEVGGRLPGGGGGPLDLDVKMVESLSILNPSKIEKSKLKKLSKAFDNLSQREIGSVFEELGAGTPEEVALDKVNPDRRELDKIIMGEILGLSEEEQLEVYKAVIHLVASRIKRAESLKKKKKKERKFDVEGLAEEIAKEIDIADLKKFPDDYDIEKMDCYTMSLPDKDYIPKIKSAITGFSIQIGDEEIECKSLDEAKYLNFAYLWGYREIKMPKNERTLRKMVKRHGNEVNKIRERIEEKVNQLLIESERKGKLKELVNKDIMKNLIARL